MMLLPEDCQALQSPRLHHSCLTFFDIEQMCIPELKTIHGCYFTCYRTVFKRGRYLIMDGTINFSW